MKGAVSDKTYGKLEPAVGVYSSVPSLEEEPLLYGKLFSTILLVAMASGQTAPNPNKVEGIHYPRVLRADIPVYPPLAWELQLTGTVEIQVVVEEGAVVNAEIKSVVLSLPKVVLTEEGKKKLPFLSNASLANVKTWQFEKEDLATFTVKYVYRIEGEPLPERGHPVIELDLPLLVKVTARPIRHEPLNSR